MQSIETWMPIVGYEGFYEVSDLGSVRGVDRVDSQGRHWKGRLLRPKTQSRGYLVVNLWREGRGRMQYIHRLALAAFVGPCPEGMEGCHDDGDQANNSLSNLRWDTSSANMRDKRRHGTDHKVNRTHCPRGHALAEPNIPASKLRTGHRQCMACSRESNYAARCKIPFSDARADERYAAILASSGITAAGTRP